MQQVTGSAGRFTVYSDGSYTGPADYVAAGRQESALATFRVLIPSAPAGTSDGQLLAVALQTDFAAWQGMREFEALRSRS